jgi:hypothetical protein
LGCLIGTFTVNVFCGTFVIIVDPCGGPPGGLPVPLLVLPVPRGLPLDLPLDCPLGMFGTPPDIPVCCIVGFLPGNPGITVNVGTPGGGAPCTCCPLPLNVPLDPLGLPCFPDIIECIFE